MLRALKKLCGNDKLENVVVVTTQWDKCQTDDDFRVAEANEQSLTEANGEFLGVLNEEHVRFLRTGHFHDLALQTNGDRYQSPRTIVEQLLGLEPEIVLETGDEEKRHDSKTGYLMPMELELGNSRLVKENKVVL